MKTLEHDGVEKIFAGITTPEEVYSVARATEDEHEDTETNELENISDAKPEKSKK